MTALYFEAEDGTQTKTAIFDGRHVGSGELDGIMFVVTITDDGNLDAVVSQDDAEYFNSLDTNYWLEKVTNYIQDYDFFINPDTGENDLLLVTDRAPKEIVGVVGKAYSFGEILQNLKTTLRP